MQMFLMNIAQSVMGFVGKVMEEPATDDKTDFMKSDLWLNVIKPIVDILDSLLVPLLILIGTAGSIYAIILGVNFAKAESADKREEAKKRMINAIIALVVTIVLLILLKLFTSYAPEIGSWIDGFDTKTPADQA